MNSDAPCPTQQIAEVSPTNAAATWDSRFQGAEYIFGTEPNAYLKRHANRWNFGQRVLCVADGEGRNSVWLAQQGIKVDAFDISEVGIEKAKKLAETREVSIDFSVSDCDSWQWLENSYDGVVAVFVQFADPAMRERLFSNIAKCLKPGGILVLQGYTPQQLIYKTGGPSIASHLYTEAMLLEAFAQMEILDLSAYEEELQEGTQHLGRSALIGLTARKL